MVYILHLLNLKDGGEAFLRQYIEVVMPMIHDVGGELLASGEALDTLPLLGGTTVGEGQRYFVVYRYPSEQAFRDLVDSPQYQTIKHLREKATTDHIFRSFQPWNPA